MLTKAIQLSEKIVQRVEHQRILPGERLPSSMELAESYGVARGTARDALLILLGRGVVYRRGKYWYVERRETTR